MTDDSKQDARKTAQQAAEPGTAFHDPTAEGGFVPHRDDPAIAPERAYQRPEAVLHDERLSAEEKRGVLEAWRAKERRLIDTPSGEHVATGGDMLAAIEGCLDQLR